MPKLSVYVPDELWERAKALPGGQSGKPNNSQVVQQALEQLLSEQESRHAAFAAGASRDPSRLAAVVEKLRDAAREDYERGYSAGLELAETIGFDELRQVMNAGGFRGERGGLQWLGEFLDDNGAADWWAQYSAAFSEGNEWINERNEPFCAGAADGLDDVWQALRANAWGTASPPDDPASDQKASADSEEQE